ncbi:SMI1/KNR4 family protein [Legionella sp.]|uniref:SMI1/KNR4 family protein n=1 Tax=Legionella sp. TaxID=459 RepID=UPI003CC3976C
MTNDCDEGSSGRSQQRKKQPFSLSQLQFSRIKPSASEEEIEALQDYIGHPLPELYKEICRHFNGGMPKFDCFEDAEGRVDEIGNFFRVIDKKEKDYSIWNMVENFKLELGKDCLPFARDSLGLSIFYLKWVNDKVQVWRLLYGELAYEFSGYYDDDDEEEEENYYCHVLVNDSFDVFLESLYAIEE